MVAGVAFPAAASDGGPQALGTSLGAVTVVLGVSPQQDGTATSVWRLASGHKPQQLATVQHAPGEVPRGAWSPQHQRTWLVVRANRARTAAPGQLLALEPTGAVRVMMDRLPLPQRAIVTGQGHALVFTGDEPSGPWTVHQVEATGTIKAMLTGSGAWVLPVASSHGPCMLAQQGWQASFLCAHAHGKVSAPVTFDHAMVRDVWRQPGHLGGVEVTPQGARMVVFPLGGARTVLSTQPQGLMQPLSSPTTVVWMDGEGQGLGVWNGTKDLQHVAAVPGRRTVPLALDTTGRIAVVRIDHPQGRAPSAYLLVHTSTGKTLTVVPGGALVEVYGVDAAGGVP